MLGGPIGALTGAMMVRGMGGAAAGGAAAAAGAAGAVAARAWGSQFVGMLRVILRGIPGMILVTLGIDVLSRVIDSWEGFKTRMLAIYAELQAAMPTWLFGGGQGFRSLASQPAIKQTERDLTSWLLGTERSIQDTLRGTSLGQWMIANGLAVSPAELARKRVAEDFASMGTQPGGLDWADAAAAGPGARGTNVTTGPINVTVNVTQSNADPNAIGAAAGNAVGSALRGVMGDTPDLGNMAVP